MQFFDKFETDSSSKGMDQMKCKMKEEEKQEWKKMILKRKTVFPLEICSYCQLFWPKHMRVTKLELV